MDFRDILIEKKGILENEQLRRLFLDLLNNAGKRNFFLYQAKDLEEKKDIDSLEKAGLISISEKEFRINNLGKIKVSEFVGKITEAGMHIVRQFS
jgi:hypothetical protein